MKKPKIVDKLINKDTISYKQYSEKYGKSFDSNAILP